MSKAPEFTFRSTLVLAGLLAVLALTSIAVGSASANAGTRASAVREARSYLSVQGFSFKGLLSQLKFEGFSTADARYGAGHAGANWNREAVKAARDYLDVSGFSRSGMVSQLMFDGFTHAQALHGAIGAGL